MNGYIKLKTWVRGGTSKVDLGWDNKNKKPVVLKHIAKNNWKQIQQEIETSRKSHETISTAVGCEEWYYDTEKQEYTMVFPCVPHLPSTDWIPFFTMDDAKRFIGQMLYILNELHTHGIIHRDVKPSNVLINQNTLNVQFIDFGCSSAGMKPIQEQEKEKEKWIYHISSARNGTPSYRTPEQEDAIEKNERWVPTTKIDIWAVGVMALEWNVGVIPLFPRDVVKKRKIWRDCHLKKKISKAYFLKNYTCKDTSKEFFHFVHCCMNIQPDMRWGANELLQHPWIQKGQFRQCFLYETINKIFEKDFTTSINLEEKNAIDA